ncbi:MAG: MBL fold metallo-hydrolase [Nocardioidaceae bacterium]
MAKSIGDSAPYTGQVHPGGPPDVLEVVWSDHDQVGSGSRDVQYCYLLQCRATGYQVLIDAAAEPDQIMSMVGTGGLTKVITTHQHWDHHRAPPCRCVGHRRARSCWHPDADAITEQTGVPVNSRVINGDVVDFGEIRLEVIAIAGHTPGSIALLYDDPNGTPHLWTGDSLFPGGVGSTFGDQEAFKQLLGEVTNKIFDRLPDETRFYPGHGNDSNLGTERPHLDEWRTRG